MITETSTSTASAGCQVVRDGSFSDPIIGVIGPIARMVVWSLNLWHCS